MPRTADNSDQLPLFAEMKTVVRAVSQAFDKKINEPKRIADPRRDLSDYPANMTARQVAAVLNCSLQHVLNLVDSGELEAKNIGAKTQRCLRFKRDHIAAYLNPTQGANGPCAAPKMK